MIMVGSQRSGAGQLARHLMNDQENDHVELHELRGFVSENLDDALNEAHAVSLGTRCTQFMFSLSISPPREAEVGIDQLRAAMERAEETLGLVDQPRALVVHEKNGRRHMHVVWSRIDAQEMKAINMSHFKTRLNEVSRDLFLENGWELPDGFKTNGWRNPLNFTLDEFQQAKRIDLDPREIKQVFQSAWAQSDNRQSFQNALEEHGYYLARGDRRGFVAVDLRGEVYSLSRWAGVKTKDLSARLGAPENLPDVETRQAEIGQKVQGQMLAHMNELRDQHRLEHAPLEAEKLRLRNLHKRERLIVVEKQIIRERQEMRDRAQKFRHGVRGVLDVVIGRAAAIRRQNERDAWECALRDRQQRDRLVFAQLGERQSLQRRMDDLQNRQAAERRALVQRIATVLRLRDPLEHQQPDRRDRGPRYEP